MRGFDFFNGGLWSFVWANIVIALIILLIVFLIALTKYILTSYATMRMAQNHNIENAGLAWIPFANYYFIGKIVGKIRLFDNDIKNMQWVLLAGSFYPVLVSFPFVGWLLPFAWMVLLAVTYYQLFTRMGSRDAVLYTILCVLQLEFIPLLIMKDKIIDR